MLEKRRIPTLGFNKGNRVNYLGYVPHFHYNLEYLFKGCPYPSKHIAKLITYFISTKNYTRKIENRLKTPCELPENSRKLIIHC